MSFLTSQEVLTRVDQQRRDDSEATVDTTKKLAALTAILQMISARGNFKFAVRKKVIEYLPGYPEYSLENVLGIEDFKDVKDLRLPSYVQPFEHIEADEFMLKFGRGSLNSNVAVEWRDGEPLLLVNYQSSKPKEQLHSGDSLTDNGTWAADAVNGDAENLDTDDLELGGESIKFDIDVSNTAFNAAVLECTGMTALDLTDFLGAGHVRAKIYLPAALVTDFSGLTLRFGSSSSAYYQITITLPANGSGWIEGENQVDFDWRDATTTGSPDIAAIDYLYLSFNYAATQADVSSVRFRDLQMVYPEKLELNYYSNYLVLNIDGERHWATYELGDELLIPHRHMETVVEGVLWQVMDQMGTSNNEDSERHRGFFEYGAEYDLTKKSSKRMGGMQLMMRELGVKPVTEIRRVRPKMRRET